MGLLMAVLVTAASIDDAKAAAELFARLDGQPMSHVQRMYADSKYHNFILYEWVETNVTWELTIVQRPKDAVGWVLLPIRWTVERTFAWLGRCRRLSKDREKSVRSSEAFVKLAMIHLMLNRLAQKKRMPSSTIGRRHKPTCGTDTEFVIGACRTLLPLAPPPSTLSLAGWIRQLGQDLFNPPNVGGWPEGRAWLTGKSIIARTKFAAALVDGRSIGLPAPIDASAMARAQGRTTSFDAIADAASTLLHGSTLSLQERRRLAPMISDQTPESLRRAVALVVASPESQLA